MFASLSEYQVHIPAPLGAPGASYTRAMALATNAAWFVLTLRMKGPDGLCETYLLSWDQDVVNVIKTAPGILEALLFVSPKWRGGKHHWVTKQISEVWEATDSRNDDEACVLMVGADGREYTGYFMAAARGVKRQALVAKVREPAARHPLNG
jgi:hypothetical protein